MTTTLNGLIKLEFTSTRCACIAFSTYGTKFFLRTQGSRTCCNSRMQSPKGKSTLSKLKSKQASFFKTSYSKLNLTPLQNRLHLLPTLQQAP